MAASEKRSSARVAPLSLTLVTAVSTMISAGVLAVDSTAAVQVMSPTVRYRTVGDMTCTAAVESTASTPAEIIVETAVTRVSERGATRADDRFSDAAMEDRKREGYF